MGDTHTKPLTEAQQAHLDMLARQAGEAIDRQNMFIAYLRAEHAAPESDGWQIVRPSEGFVRTIEEPLSGVTDLSDEFSPGV